MTACASCPVSLGTCPGTYHAPVCDDIARGMPGRAHQIIAVAAIMAGHQPPVVPSAEPEATNALIIRLHNNTFTGYGQHAAKYAKGIDPTYPVRIAEIDRCGAMSPLDPWIQSRIVDLPPRPCVVIATPNRPIRPGDMLCTMWEASRLQTDAVENCNKACCVVVTCPDVADWFRDSGVTVPIRIAPLGLDTSIFRPTRPEPTGTVVFGAGARTVHGGLRKGMGDVIEAFRRAFPRRSDVELRIKIWEDCTVPDFDDPRITVDTRSLKESEVADWLRDCSALVSASRGEGWGFWAHQALAVGRPVVAPFWGGTKVYGDESCIYPVEFDVLEVPPDFDTYGGNGAAWSVPRLDSLVDQMRGVASDPASRAAKGKAGAEMAARYTWDYATGELIKVLREFGLTPASTPALSFDDRARMLADLCPCGLGPCGCGSEPRICSHPDRPSEVWRPQCLQCAPDLFFNQDFR